MVTTNSGTQRRPVAAQRAHQRRETDHGEAFGEADPHGAAHVDVARLLADAFDLAEHGAGARDQAETACGRPQAAAGALEQFGAQHSFQIAQPQRHRRLCQTKLPGSGLHRSQRRHPKEGFELRECDTHKEFKYLDLE